MAQNETGKAAETVPMTSIKHHNAEARSHTCARPVNFTKVKNTIEISPKPPGCYRAAIVMDHNIANHPFHRFVNRTTCPVLIS
jgi:hypothetical protein